MTGFGDAAAQIDGVSYAVEIRSVNNRFFKATLRLADELSSLEAKIDAALRKRIQRGSVAASVSIRDKSQAGAYTINEATLQHYLTYARKIAEATNELSDHHQASAIDPVGLLQLPGVMEAPDSTSLAEKHERPVLELVNKAIDKLMAMREREGEEIKQDIMEHVALIDQRLQLINERRPIVVETYETRLRNRIEQMLEKADIKVDAVDLLKEVACYAERCDVAEEVQRLGAHLVQCGTILDRGDSGKPAGRTLDFLAQELLREANTIASKSNDAEISQAIVDVKGAIDRVKEQVQNIE